MALSAAMACAGPSSMRPPPRTEHIVHLPPANTSVVEASGLTHLMRALYLLHSERYEAGVTDLRLAAVYDEHSAFMHEKLAGALLATSRVEDAEAVLAEGLGDHPKDPGLNLMAGQLELEAWDYGRAVHHLRETIADDGQMPAAAAPLVDGLLWLRRNSEALATSRALMERAPGDAGLSIALGAALEDHEQLAAARDAYRRARAQQPADRGAALGDVRVSMLLGDINGAVEAMLPLVAYYPEEPELTVQLARLAREARRPDAATLRQAALSITEGDPSGRLAVAAADLVAGDANSAVAVLRESLDTSPSHDTSRLFLADLLLQRNDPVGGLKLLERVSAPSPVVWRSRARLHAALGNPEAVVADMVQATGQNTDLAALLSETARLLLQLLPPPVVRERCEAMLKHLSASLRSADMTLARAGLADALGDAKLATGELRELAAAQPTDLTMQLRLADALARYGQPSEAILLLETLVHEDPTDPTRLNALGFTLADLNRRLPEAAVFVRRAFRLAAGVEESGGMVTDSLGWLLFRQGKLAPALAWLARARAAAPDDPDIARHFGEVLLASGRRSEARAVFQEALRYAPSLPLRHQLEQRLTAR